MTKYILFCSESAGAEIGRAFLTSSATATRAKTGLASCQGLGAIAVAFSFAASTRISAKTSYSTLGVPSTSSDVGKKEQVPKSFSKIGSYVSSEDSASCRGAPLPS